MADGRPGHPPRLAGGPPEALDVGVHRHRQVLRLGDPGARGDVGAGPPHQAGHDGAIALLGGGQREAHVGRRRQAATGTAGGAGRAVGAAAVVSAGGAPLIVQRAEVGAEDLRPPTRLGPRAGRRR